MTDYLGIVSTINKECKILFAETFRLVPYKGYHNVFLFRAC